MADSRFYINKGPFSLEELAKLAECTIVKASDESLKITDVAPLEAATYEHLTFFNNVKYLKILEQTKAGACIIHEDYAGKVPPETAILISNNPYKSYALAISAFYPSQTTYKNDIDNTARIDPSAKIGKNCYIGPFSIIGSNVVIGDNSRIGANSFIDQGVIIGNNSIIGNNVSISYSIIGNNVLIYNGVRIGQDGFGFATDKGVHIKVPQIGRVLIGNNVEVGANTCIDRGSSNDTIIGDNCMIDNLVQIGHNVKLGRGCVIVAQVGIAGSTQLGDYVVLGGQVGIAGHLKIGSQVQIAAQGGVMSDVTDKSILGGSPAMPIKEWHRQTIKLKQLVTKKENIKNEQ